MHLIDFLRANKVVLVLLTFLSPMMGQSVRVDMSKHSTAIPKACQSVVPASLEGAIDVPALVKEAICKGAGDMMGEYTYMLNSSRREKNNKQVKESSTTYEVFIPELKSGTRTKGVLVTTSRNGVPVTPAELEKERREAANRIEKEEARIARETPSPENNSSRAVSQTSNSTDAAGMLPLGMYAATGINRSSFGVSRGSVRLAIATFLRNCELILLRRESRDGRETLVFKFTPRAEAQFNENERYVAQLTGEIWIDAQDRIVTRLVGWPAAEKASDSSATVTSNETPLPAVYVEMLRLPIGVWLPHVSRVNGADYPKLFVGIKTDSTSTYSNYIRFSTGVKDVKIETNKEP